MPATTSAFKACPNASSCPGAGWTEGVIAEISNARSVRLGPEPMIGAQQVQLRLGNQRLQLSTDGLAPFSVSPVPAP